MSNVVELQRFTCEKFERRALALISRMTPEQCAKVVKAIERAEERILRDLEELTSPSRPGDISGTG